MTRTRAQAGALAHLRFMEKVSVRSPSECWPWKASTCRGYGKFWADGVLWVASRYMWWASTGEKPPASAQVCHRCDNPICCNPAHLFVGSAADNQADKVNKCRHRPGEQHGMARLSRADVDEIRRQRSSGTSRNVLASRFGVTAGHITRIAKGATWKS